MLDHTEQWVGCRRKGGRQEGKMGKNKLSRAGRRGVSPANSGLQKLRQKDHKLRAAPLSYAAGSSLKITEL